MGEPADGLPPGAVPADTAAQKTQGNIAAEVGDRQQRLLGASEEAANKYNVYATHLQVDSEAWERGVAETMRDDEIPLCPVLHPEHRFRKSWDLAQVLALIYVALLVPVRTGFDMVLEPGSAEWWLELLVDVYFVLDIWVNFRTGLMADGVLEMRASMIRKRYCKGWFVVDVVSCLPISYITATVEAGNAASDGGSGANVKAFKILRLLRLAKLLRLGRLKKIIKRHEEEIENLMGYIKALSSCLLVAYTCHIVACGWYFVGYDVAPDDGGSLQLGWISREMDSTWNASGDRTEVGNVERYVSAYYWAITTVSTVGFGDIVPKTVPERCFSIVAEMFGCLMFAVLIGALGSMMVRQKLLEEKVDKQLCELREFMQTKGIPKALRVKIRRFMEVLYESKSGFDEKEVLQQLPPPMAQELLSHMYRTIISRVPMFKNMHENAITRVCGLIKPYTAMRGDVVYKHGEVGREIYIIIEGEVKITFANYARGASKSLSTGGTFGEGCCQELFESAAESDDSSFHEPYKREDSAVAISDCELRFLTLNDLTEICSDFPIVRHQMWMLSEFYIQDRLAAVKTAWSEEATREQDALGHSTDDDDGGGEELRPRISTATVKIANKMEKQLNKMVARRRRSIGEDEQLNLSPMVTVAGESAPQRMRARSHKDRPHLKGMGGIAGTPNRQSELPISKSFTAGRTQGGAGDAADLAATAARIEARMAKLEAAMMERMEAHLASLTSIVLKQEHSRGSSGTADAPAAPPSDAQAPLPSSIDGTGGGRGNGAGSLDGP